MTTATVSSRYATIARNGLWTNNQAIVALLGLCPLLAVSTTFANALGLGIATLLVVTAANSITAVVAPYIDTHIRIPAFILLIAGLVTAVEIIMQAQVFDLYKKLGIFIPLIVTNCLILARADGFAAKHSLAEATVDGLAVGSGFLLALLVIGSLRELIGQGSLFAGTQVLLNLPFDPTVRIADSGLLIAILPPGAFFLLAAIIAIKNCLSSQ